MKSNASWLIASSLLATATSAQLPPPPPVHPPLRPPVIVRPAPPLVKTEATRVETRIVDGVADTTLTMTFRNEGGADGEMILVLPLPKGATADRLEMTVDGRRTAGEVLDKDKARGIYESIVARRRDPGLLEYLDRDLLRLRVFPIPPRGTQDVHVRFRLLLPESAGMHAYEFPTRAVAGGSFALDVTIQSSKPIKNVYSPVSGMDIVRKDDHSARASFECKQPPPRDPVLFYGLSDRDFGLNLLTYRKQGETGYFLLMLAPKRDWQQEKELTKSITFVLDTSGSMQGEKIEQAKKALLFFLNSLKPNDSFNVIPFSTEARPFAPSPVAASPDKIAAAGKFCQEIEARGGTNIEEAMSLALAATPTTGSVPIVVFLTDGLPTVGVTEPKDILVACAQKNAAKARVFAFGVGDDVNTYLLDKMSGDSGGTRDYVRSGENLEVKISTLFEQLAHPVMTDVEIACDRIELMHMVPGKFPDLFRGSRLVVAGRYRGEGAVAVRLRGKVSGESKEYVYDATFPETTTDHDFVATLWAQRRVAQLLDAIRLNGQNQELVAEIRRIGKEHGIVTPYTSHLIVEEGERIAQGRWRNRPDGSPSTPAPGTGFGGALPQDRARVDGELLRVGLEAKPGDPGAPAEKAEDARRRLEGLGKQQSGARAVSDSANAARVLYLKTIDETARGELWAMQKVHGRVFFLVGGVWIDRDYDNAMEKDLRKIVAFSADYFALLREHPAIAKVLSFSTAMVVVIGPGRAVEITPPAE